MSKIREILEKHLGTEDQTWGSCPAEIMFLMDSSLDKLEKELEDYMIKTGLDETIDISVDIKNQSR